MNPVTLELALFSFLATVFLASIVGVFGAWGWALRRLWSGRDLFENVRLSSLREAPWGAPTVAAVVILYVLVNFSVTHCYATMTGRHVPRASKTDDKKGGAVALEKEVKGDGNRNQPPVAGVVPSARPDADREPADKEAVSDERAEQTQAELLGQLAVINVLLLILVPALVRLTSRATLADLGLDLTNWREQMAVGGVAALLMTPAVLAVQSVAIHIWPPHAHPVEDMLLEQFTAGVAVLAIVSTMILAPMIEELLFRGVVQRWLTRLLGDRQDCSPNLDEEKTATEIVDAWTEDDPYQPPKSEFPAAKPPPGSRSPGFSTSAIVLTSLLFAGVHFPQWPSPIGIFLLSMALGAVYQKTGSLIAAVTMHGAFNGFSTLGLLLVALSRHLQPPDAGAAQALMSHLHAMLELTMVSPG
jgi:membrane protease YdiL (CAAX protease family)